MKMIRSLYPYNELSNEPSTVSVRPLVHEISMVTFSGNCAEIAVVEIATMGGAASTASQCPIALVRTWIGKSLLSYKVPGIRCWMLPFLLSLHNIMVLDDRYDDDVTDVYR